tara:strand:+ start:130 stop:696 length:567 start_codon:yes stop_codon:yes gene_type:complete
MKYTHKFCCFICILAVYSYFTHLSSEASPIGVIDTQKVIKSSTAARSIRPQMEKLKKVYRTKFKKTEGLLQKTKKELQKQRTIMPDDYSEKLKEFQNRVRETQRQVQNVNRMFDRALANSMRRVHKTLNNITMEVAQEKELKFVFPKRVVIFFEESSDITMEVLRRLNKRLPKVKVIMPKIRPTSEKK